MANRHRWNVVSVMVKPRISILKGFTVRLLTGETCMLLIVASVTVNTIFYHPPVRIPELIK